MLDKCLFYEEKTSLPLSLLVKHRAALDQGGDLWSRTHRRKPSRKVSYTPQPRSLVWRIPLKDSGLKDLSSISFCCRLSQAWFSRCSRGCFWEKSSVHSCHSQRKVLLDRIPKIYCFMDTPNNTHVFLTRNFFQTICQEHIIRNTSVSSHSRRRRD